VSIEKRGEILAFNSMYESKPPVTRSKLRMNLGRLYFTFRRYIQWIFNSDVSYATTIIRTKLPYLVANHRTPLYRKLRKVDISNLVICQEQFSKQNKVNV